ncbi:MAG: uridine kinase [Deltaproteobacteria bacterium]|nr:MAG: uridine kinase [Deltaproteobacteria bacterium]
MKARPWVIGIAGPSCSGKTSLAIRLEERLPGAVCLLQIDDYYRDLSHLPFEERCRRNFDTPDAIDDDLLVRQVRSLIEGISVERPIYRFETHTRAPETRNVAPAPFLVIEGLFTLYWRALRELLDCSIFITTPDEVCLERRKRRDVEERGRSVAFVLAQYAETVRPMYEAFVAPTIGYADLVVNGETSIEENCTAVLHFIQRRGVGEEAQGS